jgi:hypothetical protein
MRGGFMSSKDIEYYRQRAADERALALKAERSEVAAIHEELARQYEALVDNAELRPTVRAHVPSHATA